MSVIQKLENVTFELSTIEAFARAHRTEQFDLVIGAWVFHEPMDVLRNQKFASVCAESIVKPVPIAADHVLLLKLVASLMAPQAHFVAVNRWPGSPQTLYWVNVCEAARLTLDLVRSFMLEVSCKFEGREKFPLTVFSKGDSIALVRPDDILSLHAHPYFRDNEKFCRMEGDAAEALFRSLRQEDLIYQASIKYLDNSGIEFFNVFISGALVFHYRTTTLGYREIFLSTISLLPNVLGRAMAFVEDREPYAEITQAFPTQNADLLRSYGLTVS